MKLIIMLLTLGSLCVALDFPASPPPENPNPDFDCGTIALTTLAITGLVLLIWRLIVSQK